ncbi:MAG: malto-oligosyltrehalose synthase, partial [Actinomycetota bacterium]|nr:malto-oligosyltrehalose synthase [Actinomycetota bacterium]
MVGGPPAAEDRRPLVATYRVQLRREFGFADAAAVVPYLADLGVSHLYCSPYLQAAPGSAHGYDVVDPGQINAELGGAIGREGLCRALTDRHLGQVLDIVPNHMAISGPENRWWWDVLANGPKSRFADHFDVDWDPPGRQHPVKVVLPVLGDDLERVLESGELELEPTDGGFVIRYHEHTFPVAAQSTEGMTLDGSEAALRHVLDRQHYRLAHWRSASRTLSYRRFFDVTTLIGVRVEDPRVFADTHHLVLDWLADGSLDGVRVDHIDGLRRPEEYVDRLRAAAGADAWIVVEKILEGDEQLPGSWPVAGTTGYDALAAVDGVFVDPTGRDALTELFCDVGGVEDVSASFADVVRDAKRQVMEDVLGAEVHRLTVQLMAVLHGHTDLHRDVAAVGSHQVQQTLVALLTTFPRYRAYVPEDAPAPAAERAVLEQAATDALAREPHLDAGLLRFVVDVLAGRWNTPEASPESEACMRFQQLSGPVVAKSVEDTAFYRYHRLLCLNEVGADPSRFGVDIDTFHRETSEAASRWPRSMLASSTHDTKRSEDVRARLALLS